MNYIHISSAQELPVLSVPEGFRAILIAEKAIDTEGREAISRWLVTSGCLYMMAWGVESHAWQDAVNLANLQAFEFTVIPDERLVITTCHADEALTDVFWFSKYTAMHPCSPLADAVVLHIAEDEREAELTAEYEKI